MLTFDFGISEIFIAVVDLRLGDRVEGFLNTLLAGGYSLALYSLRPYELYPRQRDLHSLPDT